MKLILVPTAPTDKMCQGRPRRNARLRESTDGLDAKIGRFLSPAPVDN